MRVQWIPLILVVAACSDTTGSDVLLETPTSLSSISLDGAVALTWSDNSYSSDPGAFENYRVYGTSYDLDDDICGDTWQLEGTTVAPEFIVGALANGAPRCFAVTAMSSGGTETDRSPVRSDTPRPDKRNVLLYARQVNNAEAGFRFWNDVNSDGDVQNGELGVTLAGSSSGADFSVSRDINGTMYLEPVRLATGVEYYAPSGVEALIEDLTSIDFAPDVTYSHAPIEARPGHGYVFEMDEGDEFLRYGAVRVTHVGTSFLIIDWAYQTDPGNPELRVSGR